MSAPQMPPASHRAWKIALGLAVALALAVVGGTLACNAVGSPASLAPPVRIADVPESWRAVREARGHRIHVTYGGVACASCHGEDGFTRPAPEVCARCHEQHTPLHDERPGGLGQLTAPPACVDCHSFTKDLTPSEACMQCHRDPQGLATGAVGIHAPSSVSGEPEDPLSQPWLTPSASAPAAAPRVAVGGAIAHRTEARCSDCHAPHARPTLDPRPCESCHEQEGQVRHAGITGDGCASCHSVHEREHDAADRCVTCHARGSGHGRASIIDPARALFAGHDVCTGCHKPHGFDRAGVTACRECHQDLPLLAEARGGAPAALAAGHRCASCHDQHDARAVRSCATCHARGPQAITSNHPAVARRVDLGARFAARSGASDANSGATPVPAQYGPGAPRPAAQPASAAACTGCHPVHDPVLAAAAGAAALACASCHTGVVSHAPDASCATCHPPHGAPAPRGAALCATCHDEKSRGVAATGHADCQQCHTRPGHRPAQPPARCESCHAPVVAKVKLGHRDCSGCHKAANHAPRAPIAACATCHLDVVASAPPKHRECLTCHTPHDGARRPEVTCASCHKDRTRGHGEPPSQNGRAALSLTFTGQLACGSCHRPHGPSGAPRPPACTQCHEPAGLPRLHRLRWHQQNCANCHAAHEPTGRSDRATCLACHQDRVQHEPTARTCATCHPFTE